MCKDVRGSEYLSSIFSAISQTMGRRTPSEAIEKFRQMLINMGIQNPVSDDRTSDISLLVSSVNPVRLKNNPILLSDSAIRNLYSTILS